MSDIVDELYKRLSVIADQMTRELWPPGLYARGSTANVRGYGPKAQRFCLVSASQRLEQGELWI